MTISGLPGEADPEPGVSAYNNLDATANQERFRDFVAPVSFEGKRPRPFI